tara:strand:- start:37 stop:519 length:483 start_codon:yes stop_codon:yes gene_type:complete
MKAVNNNGIITTYPDVPKQFRSSTGYHLNARGMTADELRNAGMFDVIIPEEYDSRVHNLDEIYFDSAASVFKKDIINKTWSQTLAQLKEQQINNFKGQIGSKLTQTDWYIIRNADDATEIPADITTARAELRTQSNTVETEINALTTKKAVMSYDFPNIG